MTVSSIVIMGLIAVIVFQERSRRMHKRIEKNDSLQGKLSDYAKAKNWYLKGITDSKPVDLDQKIVDGIIGFPSTWLDSKK